MLRIVQNSRGFLKDTRLRLLFTATISTLLTGTVVYHFVEGWSFIDAFYFSAITLTTVGYGDFSLQTVFGKIFTVFYILAGIGIIFGFIDAFFRYRSDKMEESMEEKKRNSGV